MSGKETLSRPKTVARARHCAHSGISISYFAEGYDRTYTGTWEITSCSSIAANERDLLHNREQMQTERLCGFIGGREEKIEGNKLLKESPQDFNRRGESRTRWS